MCTCFELDCRCEIAPRTILTGEVLTKNNGTKWTVLGLDASGQGFVLRGEQGQINCEPMSAGRTLRFPGHWML